MSVTINSKSLRVLISFSILILLIHVIPAQGLLGPAVRILTNRSIRQLEKKSITILTKKQVQLYLPSNINLHENEIAVYSKGTFIGMPSGMSQKTPEEISLIFLKMKEEDEMKKRHEDSVRNAYLRRPDIKRIQFALRLIGYTNSKGALIKIDGILGPETRSAIENIFGIDCNNLSENQIIESFIALNSNKNKKDVTTYNLIVKNKNTDKVIEYKDISDKMINTELQQFKCDIGEICSDLKSGSVEFECEMDGVTFSINISTNGSIDVGFKSPNGSSAKLSVDKDGKMKISMSDGKQSRGTKL